MTLHHKLAITGISVIALGLIGLSPFVISWTAAKQPVAQTSEAPAVALQKAQPATKTMITGKPVRLEVSAASINLAVIEGSYSTETGEWTLTDDKVQFAMPTSQPNDEAGNTLIYGHDTPAIFHRLHDVTPGAEAKVFTENGHVLTYKLRTSEVVDPKDTSIFAYDGKPQLTLQTCTGIWSENRKFFYFDLVNAQ